MAQSYFGDGDADRLGLAVGVVGPDPTHSPSPRLTTTGSTSPLESGPATSIEGAVVRSDAATR